MSKTISGDKTVFVGPGLDNNLYFYSPKLKTFTVYNFKTLTSVKIQASEEFANADKHFLTKDPCKKE